MRGHCRTMGDELDRQNGLINKIDGKMDRANNKTNKVNKIVKK